MHRNMKVFSDETNDSTGGAEGGPRTERNEHRIPMMITEDVECAVSTVTGSEATGHVSRD